MHCQVEAKKDGTGATPALVHSGDEGHAPQGDAGEAPQGPGEDPHGHGNGGDRHVGGGAGGDEPPGGGGDGPPEGDKPENNNEDEEEEHEERDPEMPATPAGEESSSEDDWVRQGYSRDDIIQKRHQKEMRRKTAKSAVAALDAVQEALPEAATVTTCEEALAAEETEKILKEMQKEAEEEESAQMEKELLRKQKAEEQIKRREEILKEIESRKAKEKEQQKIQGAEKSAEAEGSKASPAAFIQVKEEEMEEVEPLAELACLCECFKRGYRCYLGQGLCVKMYCPLFYMRVPNASSKLEAKENCLREHPGVPRSGQTSPRTRWSVLCSEKIYKSSCKKLEMIWKISSWIHCLLPWFQWSTTPSS